MRLYEVATLRTRLALKTTLGSPALQQVVAPAFQAVMPLTWLHLLYEVFTSLFYRDAAIAPRFLFQVMPFLVAANLCFEPPSECVEPRLVSNFG